jgi:2-hydroxycyclohexanecarboxyl-CoA dehydrogenase
MALTGAHEAYDKAADLAGRVAVITGSTRGIGLATARRLARQGASVVLNSRTGDGSEALKDLDLGERAIFVASDVSAVAGAQRLVDLAVDRFGRVDVWVNNASPNIKVDFFDRQQPGDWHQTIDGKMFTTINCIHAVLPAMQAQGEGCIVNIVSDAARVGTAGESLVSAAYGGVIALTKSLAREFARHRIRVNCVSITLTTGTPGYERIIADEVEYFVLAKRVTGQTLSVNSGLSFPG